MTKENKIKLLNNISDSIISALYENEIYNGDDYNKFILNVQNDYNINILEHQHEILNSIRHRLECIDYDYEVYDLYFYREYFSYDEFKLRIEFSTSDEPDIAFCYICYINPDEDLKIYAIMAEIKFPTEFYKNYEE